MDNSNTEIKSAQELVVDLLNSTYMSDDGFACDLTDRIEVTVEPNNKPFSLVDGSLYFYNVKL